MTMPSGYDYRAQLAEQTDRVLQAQRDRDAAKAVKAAESAPKGKHGK